MKSKLSYASVIIVVLGVIMNHPPLSKAGPMVLLNEQAKAVNEAAQAKTADTDAAVTLAHIKSDLDDVGTALEAVTTSIDAIDMSTIDPAQFTGTQKTCIQALKQNLNALKVATKDLMVAAKNNMQATNKLVKKMKRSDEIDTEKGVHK